MLFLSQHFITHTHNRRCLYSINFSIYCCKHISVYYYSHNCNECFQNNFHQDKWVYRRTENHSHLTYNNVTATTTHISTTNKQTNKNHATRHDAKHYCKLYKNNTAYVLMPLTISTRASFPDRICKPTYTPFGCQKDTCHWRKSFRAFSQPPLQYKQWQDKFI